MNKKKFSLRGDGMNSVLASLISIIIGLLAGCMVILICGLTNPTLGLNSAWEGIRLVLAGMFSTGRDAVGALTFGFNPIHMGNLLFRATPIILTGLSVAVSFKTGLFNIGAPGQYLAGTTATLFIALSIPSAVIPAPIIWLLAFAGGMLAGALWGCIPGLLKALLNINEVLACIMTNWIAANLVTWIFDISNLKNMVEDTKSGYIYKTTFNGVATSKMGLDQIFPGSQVNGGIIIAIVIAIGVYVLMNKTTLGYQLKACGANRHAARYAGIKDKRNIVLSMAIAGALAAGGASLYFLSGNAEFAWTKIYQSLPEEGFNGIPVALLATNHPIGVIFSSIFMSMLNINGQMLQNLTSYNKHLSDIIIAAIVYLSSFSLLIKMLLSKKKKEKAAPSPEADKAEAKEEPAQAAEEQPPAPEETAGDSKEAEEG